MKHRNHCSEGGFATAEAAVVLPTLLLLVSLAVGAILAVGAQLKCVDAAHEVVRLAARGESPAVAREAGARLGPPGSTVTVTHDGRWVEATVRVQLRPLRLFPGLMLGASARAEQEGS